MLQISNLQLSLDENPQSLESLIMKKLRLRPGRLKTSRKIVKESLDARVETAAVCLYRPG